MLEAVKAMILFTTNTSLGCHYHTIPLSVEWDKSLRQDCLRVIANIRKPMKPRDRDHCSAFYKDY